MTTRSKCVTPSLPPPMCVCGMGLPSVQAPPSHHPSSLAPPPPPPAGLCSVLLCGSVVCFAPPPSRFWNPPPPCALLPGLLVGWLSVFGFLGWLLRWLVGCWLIGSSVAKFGWLVGWFVGWLVGSLVGWLLASCWGVCVCIVWTHAVWCCYTVHLCVSLPVQPLQGSFGG